MSSSSLWRVRDGRIEDEDDIVTFQCQLAMETEHRALTEDVVRQGVRNVLNGKIDSAKYFVAEDIHCTSPGKAIGSLMITKEWSDWRNGYFMWIQSVYVEEVHRKKGAFRSLYEHVRDLCLADSQYIGLRLYAEKDNDAALSTYLKLGMQVTDYHLLEWTTPSCSLPTTTMTQHGPK